MSTPKEDKLAKLKFEDITMGMNVSQTKVRISLEGEDGCPGIQVDKAWLLRLRDRMTELAGKLVDEEANMHAYKEWLEKHGVPLQSDMIPIRVDEGAPENFPVLVWKTFPHPGRWEAVIHAAHYYELVKPDPHPGRAVTHWMKPPPPPKVETQEDKDRKALEKYSKEMVAQGTWPPDWDLAASVPKSPSVRVTLKLLEKAWYAACNYARGGAK